MGFTDSDHTDSLPWEPVIPFEAVHLPPWPVGALPPILERYVGAVAESWQVPLELPAMMVRGAVATCVQRRVRVALGADWQEPLCLYLMPILPPAEKKSGVVSEVTAPLVAWERDEAERLAPSIAEHNERILVLEKQREQARAASSKGAPEDREGHAARALELARELAELKPMVAPRLLTDDATTEQAITILSQQDGRLSILAAEPSFLEICMGRYSDRPNLDLLLKGHAGDDLRVDRRGRTEYVSRPALTLAVCVQPEAVRAFVGRETKGRGAVARFLTAWPSSHVGYRSIEERPVPQGLRSEYHRLVRRLLSLPYEEEVRLLSLSLEARPAWIAWREEVEVSLRPGGSLDGMQDWGGKLAGAVARIAGVLHMAEHAHDLPLPWETPISEHTLLSAIRIGRYFIPHAQHTYGQIGLDEDRELAQHILRLIRESGAPTISKRDLWRMTRGRLQTASLLDAPLRSLEYRGYIRKRPRPPGPGRPAETYDVHPDPPANMAIMAKTPTDLAMDQGFGHIGHIGGAPALPEQPPTPSRKGAPQSW